MNLDALTQIPLADLGMGVIVLVLAIGGSLYARKHGVSLRADSPAHKFADEAVYDPAYACLSGNVNHSDDD
jgi:hypothetical protein